MECDQLHHILRQASELALEQRAQLEFTDKTDNSLVTNVDVVVGTLISELLTAHLPEIVVVNEEDPVPIDDLTDIPWAAVVDPIDGTHNFIAGLERWGICIGIMHHGTFCYGALALPDYGTALILASDGLFEVELRSESRSPYSPPPRRAPNHTSIVSMAQRFARAHVSPTWPTKGGVSIEGSVVYSLYRTFEGKVVAYVGLVNLWDIGGAIPLMHALGFSAWWFDSGIKASLMVSDLIRGDGGKNHYKLKEPIFIARESDLRVEDGDFIWP
ncbi:MAG: hypothetical protein EA401_07530 [Planctomycetota bacterium]|nr:MAG: hypothetical protein EA401_07530 [Planctomycetota bacterium]